jgi:hypothetical protein
MFSEPLFDFVDSIAWEAEAEARGLTLTSESIGTCVLEDHYIYAARCVDGSLLVWDTGECYVETAEEFAARQKTHSAINFP